MTPCLYLLLSSTKEDLTARLDALMASPALRGAVTGVMVMRNSGEFLYSHNATTRLVPASNQKVVTALFAFEVLGPDFRPQTKFWKEGNKLFVEPMGDPSLTTAQLQGVRQTLQLADGTEVFIRHRWEPGYPPSWEYDDLPFRYAAPIHSLSVDRAAFTLNATATELTPLPFGLGVGVEYVPGEGALRTSYSQTARRLVVSGKLPAAGGAVGSFAQPDPSGYAISLLGKAGSGSPTWPTRDPDFIITGPSLRQLAADCLKPSDNIYAEHLMLMAARAFDPTVQSHDQAARAMGRFYAERVGLTIEDIRPVDGSGLSRHNLVTPWGMARILRFVLNKPYQGDFVRALPSPGEGTLRSRLPGVAVAAKTGTLNSVTSLSGYIKPGQPNGLIFSVMMNNGVRPAAELREVQDAIVKELALFINPGDPLHDPRNPGQTLLVQERFSNASHSSAFAHWIH